MRLQGLQQSQRLSMPINVSASRVAGEFRASRPATDLLQKWGLYDEVQRR